MSQRFLCVVYTTYFELCTNVSLRGNSANSTVFAEIGLRAKVLTKFLILSTRVFEASMNFSIETSIPALASMAQQFQKTLANFMEYKSISSELN